MPTLTGRNTRTISGYAISLLEYPRWTIEREVDFTHCHLSGSFAVKDEQCGSCRFGQACCWLNLNRTAPSPDTPLAELLQALGAAVEYLRSLSQGDSPHPGDCQCDNCQWLNEAMSFLRTHRHRT